MDKIQKLKQQKEYEEYVKQKTPRHNLAANMFRAFLLGGLICAIGQVIRHYCEMQGLSTEDCSAWTSVILVLLSVLLTGVGIYPTLATWGGAGPLVPRPGLPIPVSAPAIDSQQG